MAIKFDGTDDVLSHALTENHVSGSGNPYTIAGWVKRNSTYSHSDMRGVMIRNRKGAALLAQQRQFTGVTFGFDDLIGGGPTSPTRLHAVSYESGTSYSNVSMSYNTTIDVWYHFAAVFHRGATDREIWVNGTLEGSSGTAKGPINFLRASFGAIERITTTRFADISLDRCCLFNAALEAEEIETLASGAEPWEARPESCILGYDFTVATPRESYAMTSGGGTGVTYDIRVSVPLTWTTGSVPATEDGPGLAQPQVAMA